MAELRLAICDDCAPDAERAAALCSAWLGERGIEHATSVFSSADELMADLRQGGGTSYDLYLLDIRLEDGSGLDVARWLFARGVRDRVILTTAYAEYALEAYDAHPLHYLVKPLAPEAVGRALDLATECARPRTVVFRRGARTLALPASDVCYLESRSHGVVVHERAEEHVLPLSLNKAERAAPPELFARCHKSYLVNLGWVERTTRTDVYLRDGTCLPRSRTFSTSFQTALVRHLSRA